MRKIFEAAGDFIRSIMDVFYPLFRRYMTIDFFRYGTTGVCIVLFDWVMYFVIYNFVLQHRMLHLGFVTLSSHIATLAIKLPFVLAVGFLMQKYVAFAHSELQGRVQLFRYLVVFIINFTLTYFGLKLLVDVFGFYPTPSNMLVTIVLIFVSYLSQKHYIFKS